MEWVAHDFNLRFLLDDASRSSLRQHEDGRPRLGAAPLLPVAIEPLPIFRVVAASA